MVERDSPQLFYMPVDKALLKEGECFAYRDKWWAFCPERGLIFLKCKGINPPIAQCYQTAEIAKETVAKMYPWAKVKHMELVLTENKDRLYYD